MSTGDLQHRHPKLDVHSPSDPFPSKTEQRKSMASHPPPPPPPPPSSSESARRCPPLPVELWVRIISNIAHSNVIPHVWLSCRRVSRTVRAAAEEAFLHRHLKPRTHIKFRDLGMVPDSHGWKHYLNLTLEFDRLSEDRKRVVFSNRRALREEEEEEDEGEDEEEGRRHEKAVEDALTERWRAAMRLYQGNGYGCRIDLSPYTITVRQIINDTELPGLEIDYEAREMSFDWRAMFDRLFGEECYAMKLNLQMRGDVEESKAIEVQKAIKSGETELFQGISQMMRILSERERQAYRDARRIRIRRWYIKNEGYTLEDDYFHGDFQERQKLKDLRAARKYDIYDADSEDEDLQDEVSGVYDQGMGFSRFDVGDAHEDGPFERFESTEALDDDVDNAFEEWLRTRLPTNMNDQLPDTLGDGSDSEASYEDSTEAEDDEDLAQH
ncbi:heterogeneous nuclear ribonucleoprotein r [Diplodia corticola]|uniref:Heterogeneous nuclear ribonucleoprotein r n=1 Tax=Diplodia corticola TaxID=236234 RepID=A0A1J9RB49_9PEZI|nr:heterogeneous nuclear ribonucleoprotein r [Diplodia corticola]OJD37370.1 heterogeneous nuclear ribonucleoprotein r [Diplodia corticola]